LRLYVRPWFGERPIKRIGPADIRRWQTHLATSTGLRLDAASTPNRSWTRPSGGPSRSWTGCAMPFEQVDRTLALISAAYLALPHCRDEWTGAFLHDRDGRNRLLQVRIEDREQPRLLGPQVYIDPIGLPREQARARLLAEVRRGRRKPWTEPPFPLSRVERAGPRFPGYGPEVTKSAPRNPDFSGRAGIVAAT
jgi:TIR domain-containing protein